MKKIFIFLMTTLLSVSLFAKAPKVGIIFSTGGLGDKSFNDAAYKGLVEAKEKYGIDFKYVEPASPAEDEGFLRDYAEAGYDLIIATGFQAIPATETVAADYPELKFAIIDGVIDLPNVKSLIFKEEEGSFLVGVIAGLMTKTNTIGFVGGMENPLMKKFEVGFEQGAKYIKPDLKFLSVYVNGANPFNDPVKGKEMALSEIEQGADVVYHAAGGTGIGVLQAAKEKGVFAIGVDSNQDAEIPGTILTSMIKKVDTAVLDSVKTLVEGTFTPGVTVYGAAENGVGVTDFEFTKEIIGEEKLNKFYEIQKELVEGKIKVSDK